MIFSPMDKKQFSLKYDIEITKDTCRGCKCEVEVDIPIISKDFVGFCSKEHECGKQYIIYVLKSRNENFWETE
jgi:hypothetical protein